MSSAEWITDRPPTEADGDEDGNVWMRLSPLATTHFSVHWSYVGGRAPWRHAPGWQPSAEPAPAEPPTDPTRRVVQIAFDAVDAGRSALIALCSDGSLWCLQACSTDCSDGSLWCLQACSTDWTELPAIPQP